MRAKSTNDQTVLSRRQAASIARRPCDPTPTDGAISPIVADAGAAEGTTMVELVVVIGAAMCAAVAVWWLASRSQVNRDAERFASARAMTNRWAEDPTSAPKPVLDI